LKPIHEQRNTLIDFDAGGVPEPRSRAPLETSANVIWHVPGLHRLAVDDRLFAERVLEQFNHAAQLHDLRLAQIENLIAEFLLRASRDAVEDVADERIVSRRRTITKYRDGLPALMSLANL